MFSRTYSDLLILARPDFDDVMAEFPHFLAKMQAYAVAQRSAWGRVRSAIRAGMRTAEVMGGSVVNARHCVGSTLSGYDRLSAELRLRAGLG